MKLITAVALLLMISICVCSIWARTSDELRLTLPNGNRLIGKSMRSTNGRLIKAYEGVPYAKPPLGKRRFKAPEPIGKWDKELKATELRPVCIQRSTFGRSETVDGAEDCLYLNIYTPFSHDKIYKDLPVMVWIHGGGLQCTSGISLEFPPQNMMDHDIVLVHVEYRLGPLGFLATDTDDCPGNFGLKDQAAALKWIHDNIEAFGGDENSVTVFGNSAGGASVTYLMMSPLTKGLITRGIAESGTNLAPWSQPAHEGVARKRAIRLAESFNCHYANNWRKTLDCLREIPADKITNAFWDFFEWDTDPMVPFPPVVEPANTKGAFMTKHPREQYHSKAHALDIPLMIGVTYDEGTIKTAAMFAQSELLADFIAKFQKATPIALYYDHHKPHVRDWITKQITEFYFANHPTTDKQLNVTNLFGDGWFLGDMDQYLRLRFAQKPSAPTYSFLYTHEGASSFTEYYQGDAETNYGVSHADELQYLFPYEKFTNAMPTKDDETVRKSLIQLWVDFARTGNPTPASSNLPKWIPANHAPVTFYRIGNANYPGKQLFGMEDGGIFQDRADFWRRIGAHSPARDTETIIKKDEL